MALSSTNIDKKHVASASGFSAHIALLEGKDWRLSFTCAGAFVLTLQEMAGDGASFDDCYIGATKVVIDSSADTAKQVIVPGGSYRMNVTDYNLPITMWAKEA